MRRRNVIIIVLLALIGAAFVGYSRLRVTSQASSDEWQVVVVEKGTLTTTVSATGSIEPRAEAALSFRASGRVTEIAVEEGDYVEADQVLAKLETRDLELQVVQARANFAVSQARLEEVEAGPTAADLASAEANLESAIANLERVRAGANEQDIAAAEANLESATANYEQVEAGPSEEELVVARSSMKRAEAALKQAQAEYDKVAWQPGVGASPQATALEQASVDYEQAKANYELARNHPTESELKAAAAQVAQAQAQLCQLESSPTDDELKAAAAQVAQAQAQLDKLENSPTPQELAIARAQVDQVQAALDQAQDALESATIVAPFAGTVATVGANVNERVSPNTPVIVLVDDSTFQISIDVDEADLGRVNVGQEVRITLEAFRGQELKGRVTAIAPTATLGGGVVSYLVTIGVEPGDIPLRTGMTVDAAIVTERREEAILVPNQAIRVDTETGQVYVEKLIEGQPIRVEVILGLFNEATSEVLAGLEAGDQVVVRSVSGTERLRELMSAPGG